MRHLSQEKALILTTFDSFVNTGILCKVGKQVGERRIAFLSLLPLYETAHTLSFNNVFVMREEHSQIPLEEIPPFFFFSPHFYTFILGFISNAHITFMAV